MKSAPACRRSPGLAGAGRDRTARRGAAPIANRPSDTCPGVSTPIDRASRASRSLGPTPRRSRSVRETAPSRFASRSPSGPSTRGTWAYSGVGRPSRRCSRTWRGVVSTRSSPRTPGRRRWSASSDHHGQVVRRHPVGPAQHEIVDDAADRADEPVGEPDRPASRPQPQRRPPTLGRSVRPLGVGEVTTCPRVGAVGRRAVGRSDARSTPADLAPGAEARVRQRRRPRGGRGPRRTTRCVRTGARPGPSWSRPSAARSATC